MTRGLKHGWGHRLTRRVHLAATLATGRAPLCCYCGRPIPGPSPTWDLAHAPDGGYRPPGKSWAHRPCNRGDPTNRWGGRPHPWSRGGRKLRAQRALSALPGVPPLARRRVLLPKGHRMSFWATAMMLGRSPADFYFDIRDALDPSLFQSPWNLGYVVGYLEGRQGSR